MLCHKLYVILRLCGLQVGELHSKLPQSARLHNLAMFARGDLRVLLATDLAARGLDIKGVDTVINYQLNSSYQMYVHRVGRTARAGNKGLAISLVPDKDYKIFKNIKKESKTIMYERVINKELVLKWQEKLPELSRVCEDILFKEREAIRLRDMVPVVQKVQKVVDKNQIDV